MPVALVRRLLEFWRLLECLPGVIGRDSSRGARGALD
jgi:hypothetical protein